MGQMVKGKSTSISCHIQSKLKRTWLVGYTKPDFLNSQNTTTKLLKFKTNFNTHLYFKISVISRLRNFMQEFLVKYAHKYAQKSTKIAKNDLKYALNMQNIILI